MMKQEQQLTYRTFRSQRVFGSLDGLRAASILAVIWHHTGDTGLWPRLSSRGFLGVDMFFVISGFLIVTLLLREHDRHCVISIKRFYARRFLRIFPLYYGAIAVLCIHVIFVSPEGSTGQTYFHDLPFLLTYTTNWVGSSTLLGISWSLSAEEQFYLLWPPLERLFKRHVLGILLFLLFLSWAVALGVFDTWLALWPGWRPDEPSMLRETTFAPLLLGVLLAHILHSKRGFQMLAHWLGNKTIAPILAVFLLLVVIAMPLDIRGPYRPVIHLIMTAFCASCVIREDHSLSSLFKCAPIKRIGVVSYGMYLLHLFVYYFVVKVVDYTTTELPFACFFGCLSFTYLLAELSYRYYETPFLNLKQRFAR